MKNKNYNRIHLISAFSLGLLIAVVGLFAAQNSQLFKGDIAFETGALHMNESGENSEVKITEAPINARQDEGENENQPGDEVNLTIESGSMEISNNNMIDYDPNRFRDSENKVTITNQSDPEALRMEIEALKKTIERLKSQCGL